MDARFINAETVAILKDIKIKRVHFAFDLMKNEDAIVRGLKLFKKVTGISQEKAIVYILTNFNTTYEQDMHRIKVVAECGYLPDVRIYRKETAPKLMRDLQRWCNNRHLYKSCSFLDYVPRADGKAIRQLYFEEVQL